jgi:ABC-type Fe3+ transport system permease subunit
MNGEILLADVQLRLILALCMGVFVMIFLLILEHMYEKKHPEYFIDKPNSKATKMYSKHLSNMFIVILVYVFSFLLYIGTVERSFIGSSIVCFSLLAITIIWNIYNIRK